MKRTLQVWFEGQAVGKLTADTGRWSLLYDAQWLKNPQVFALSPYLPLRGEGITDDSTTQSVRWFFENLLPEGAIRDELARIARIPPSDTLGLLRHYGEESAGALTLLPEGVAYPEDSHYKILSGDELRRIIDALPATPLLAFAGQARMSLAGAQHKLLAHREHGGLCIPQGPAAPSSLILCLRKNY